MIEKKGKDKWKSPVNLGSQVNSQFQEITPFLASDNKTLFFASNGRNGEGSFDIYYSFPLFYFWLEVSSWFEKRDLNLGRPVILCLAQ